MPGPGDTERSEEEVMGREGNRNRLPDCNASEKRKAGQALGAVQLEIEERTAAGAAWRWMTKRLTKKLTKKLHSTQKYAVR
jgi:hypothetical protein